MLTDKELKKKYKKRFSEKPNQSYPVEAIKSLGMKRSQCEKCGKFFWSVNERKVCGDSECSGGYTFIGKPRKNKIDYVDFWSEFSKIMNNRGYQNIDRYPVVARWRDDIPFVEASIDDFIPYVVNGVSPPPKNPLIVPQSCLRFNDLDNVGITGAHYSCFLMVGQHRFEKPKDYDFNQYLLDLYKWFDKGLGLSTKELVLHEDIWAGSGNFGPCIEFFSNGLELANQVYMQYKQTNSGHKDLDVKVLDMGLGYERNVWFSQGKSTSYETTFPTVMKKLRKITGVGFESDVVKRFLPYSSYLNIDEVSNIDKQWEKVADKINMTADNLKKKVLPMSALYSIAEHSRAVCFGTGRSTAPRPRPR